MELYAANRDSVDAKKMKAVWGIKALSPKERAAAAVIGGQPPAGFETVIPLAGPLLPSMTYTVIANDTTHNAVWAEATFKPDEVNTGDVVFDNDVVKATSDYDKIPGSWFGCGG